VLVYLIDNTFGMFDGRVFQQVLGIPSMCSSSGRSVPLFIWNTFHCRYFSRKKKRS